MSCVLFNYMEPNGFIPTQFVNFGGPNSIWGPISPRVDVAHKTASIKSNKSKAIHQK